MQADSTTCDETPGIMHFATQNANPFDSPFKIRFHLKQSKKRPMHSIETCSNECNHI